MDVYGADVDILTLPAYTTNVGESYTILVGALY
jgi:hypothetical protein